MPEPNKIQNQVPISELSSFKNSGHIQTITVIQSKDGLAKYLRDHTKPWVLGKGSNTLLNPDSDANIIKLSPTVTDIEIKGNQLSIPAATSVNKISRICKELGLSGMEFSAGVPASLGGMVTMNFGCWGSEIAERICSVQIMDSTGKIHQLSKDECQFSYRHSCIQEQDFIVIDATLSLVQSDSEAVRLATEKAIEQRIQKQPLRAKTFGSIFKNPEGHAAAALIDNCGLKGKAVGAAEISSQHANFMCNKENASFNDAHTLLMLVQEEVAKKTAIQLQPEVQIML